MHPFRLLVFSSFLGVLAACGEEHALKVRENSRIPSNFDQHLPVVQTLFIKSLIPQLIQLPSGVNLVNEGLPRGLQYNAEQHSIHWLPQQNQAGTYYLHLSQEQQEVALELKVEAQPEELLRLGPPQSYRDGDVGYFYIHGMTMNHVCKTKEKGWSAWRKTADIVSPDQGTRSAACYDGRGRIDTQAAEVARQIIDAPCGTFNKCIVIAHSMGALMFEYMLLHADDSSHANPQEQALFRQVRDKTLFVIELGSASGGSEVANVVKYPDRYPKLKHLIGRIGNIIPSRDAIDVLATDFATEIGAPLNGDPQVPVFMVPGYSRKNLLSRTLIGKDDAFNGHLELAALDRSMALNSRTDGVISFRSACGIASDDETHGPGYKATLDTQFDYCFLTPKKPRHHVWFSMNLNHYAIASPFSFCKENPAECQVHSLDINGNIVRRVDLQGMDSVSVLRHLLANAFNSTPQETDISM